MAKISRRLFVDRLVGELNRIGQAGRTLRYSFKSSSSHRCGIAPIPAEIIEDRIHGDLARQFPGLLSAHAVADHKYSVPQIIAKVVFVVLAYEADVSISGGLDHEAHGVQMQEQILHQFEGLGKQLEFGMAGLEHRADSDSDYRCGR